MNPAARAGLIALIVCLAGCFETEESDGTIVFRFATWVLLIPIGIGLASLAAGLYLRIKRKVKGKRGIIPFLVSAAALGIFFPNMLLDRVTVSPEHLEQTTGFWFARNRKGFRFEEVRSISRKTTYRAKGAPNEKWIVRFKDGRTETIDPGDLWERNGDVIIPKLKSHGVRIE